MNRRWSPRAGPSTSPSPTATAIGGVRVRPTSKSLVVPASPTNDHWLSLSNLDRVVNPTFSSAIFFYENVLNGQQNFSDVVEFLKNSLAEVLVDFFPLAGRLALREDGLVDLHCNDEGAMFFEASVDFELSAIGGPGPMPALSGLEMARVGPGPKYIPDQLQSMPVLIVMVTKFRCGSFAVAVNWHHTVADGSAGCHFMKSWAERATGKELSVAPNHDRSILKPRSPPDASLVNGYSTTSTENIIEEQAPDVESPKSGLPRAPAILDSFPISKLAVQQLKEKMSSEDDEHRQFTSAVAVCGDLWYRMTRARADQPKEQKLARNYVSRFFMFVDGRKKLGLPPGYFGNAVCSACAATREDDILHRPRAHAASLIKAAVNSITGEYFQSLIDWVEIQGSAPSKSEHVNSLGHDVAATFWTFFPLYEMDFGWGKPALAVRNSPARPLIDGIAMMPSPEPGSGNMVAVLNLHKDRMDRLVRQESFKTILCN